MNPALVLTRLALLLAVAPSGAPTKTVPVGTGSVAGVYVGRTLNRHSLPAEDKFVASNGYYHWVKLEKVFLRLSENGRFTLSVRYYHEHLPSAKRPKGAQLLEDVRQGTYRVSGRTITFIPRPKRGETTSRPVSGSVRGEQIEVQFSIRDGARSRPMTLVVERDRSYW